jgi:hypothetical protein
MITRSGVANARCVTSTADAYSIHDSFSIVGAVYNRLRDGSMPFTVTQPSGQMKTLIRRSGSEAMLRIKFKEYGDGEE